MNSIDDILILLGLITKAPSSGFKKNKLGEYFSKTYVGEGHPLYKYAKKEQSVDVHELPPFDKNIKPQTINTHFIFK